MAITFFIIMRSRRAAQVAQARALALQSVSPSVDIEASCATAATKSSSAICTVPDRRMDTVTTHSDASLRPETPAQPGKSDFAPRKPDFAPPPPTSMRAPPPPIPMRAPPPPTPMRELTPRRRPPPTAPAIAAADEAAEEARRQPRKRHRHRRPRDGANAAEGAAPNAPPPHQQLPPQQQSPQPRRASSRNLKRHASSFLDEEFERNDALAHAEMPAQMREQIDALRRERRHGHRESREMHRSRELSREVTQLFPGEDGRRSSRERHGERRRSRETAGSAAEGSSVAPNADVGAPPPPSSAAGVRPAASPFRSVCAALSSRWAGSAVMGACATSATTPRPPAMTPQLKPASPPRRTPRPPNSAEQDEMAVFIEAEVTRQKQHAAISRDLASGSFKCDFSAPAKLRVPPRAAVGGGGGDGGSGGDGGGGGGGGGVRQNGGGAGCAHVTTERQMYASAAARAAAEHLPAERPPRQRREGGGTKQKRRPAKATEATRAAAEAAPEVTPRKTGVEALHERRRVEEATFKQRESKKHQADKLLHEWLGRTRGDVYEMMGSVKLFTDLFDSDPLAGILPQRGHAAQLKKAWHKLAAKLHPDRQQQNSVATQVLAEEVFKALTIAYAKENERLGVRA